MGKRKLQKYLYEYLKVGKINSLDMLQFHLIPTGKMMSIHLSKELLHWHLLVLISCWLEGEGGNVQETSILEGSHFVLWDLGLLTALPSSTDSFLLAHGGSGLNQIRVCLPLPVLPLLEVRNVSREWLEGFQFPASAVPREARDFICSYLWAIYTTFNHFLKGTIPLLYSYRQVKVYLGMWRQCSGFKIIHTI